MFCYFFKCEERPIKPILDETIEVASVIDRKGLARASSWFMITYQIYLSVIDTIVTGLLLGTVQSVLPGITWYFP